MKSMKLNAWGQEHELCIRQGNYREGGGLSLYLYEPDVIGYLEPWGSMTTNTEAYAKIDRKSNCALVDTNNCPEAVDLIRRYRLGKPTGRYASSGRCLYPEYSFDMDAVDRYSENPGGCGGRNTEDGRDLKPAEKKKKDRER